MTEMTRRSSTVANVLRSRWLWAVTSILLILIGIRYWLTPSLEPVDPLGWRPIERSKLPISEDAPPEWPAKSSSGTPAKTVLLSSLKTSRARLVAAGAYTATFHKRERFQGKLADPQVLEMKCRHDPFGVYLKFRTPEPGKEVVYREGRYDNQVIAHGVGKLRWLVPVLKVAPDSAFALVGNRHPITDAGLLSLTNRLIRFRELDLTDPQAETLLDRYRDESGREWLRSIHTHPARDASRPFKEVEVLYDPATRIPHQISNYDWPEPGEIGPLKLAERYTYDDLDLKAQLSDLDFDPANPAYDFSPSSSK